MRINFDITGNPENPTLVLAYRDGRKIGELVAENIVVKGSMINPSEISFKVRKFLNGNKNALWDKITDFKLLWYKEADLWFEIYIDIDETNETIKGVLCTQLGQAELSQIKLYDVEINTENDIARDDYVIPTVLYNSEHPEASLLHRIMEKAPHYSIAHVDSTIANIQRTFAFDNKSITDAFQEIAEEIGCLFIYPSNSDDNGNIQRTISVYDLESNCSACGHRGEFTSTCPECGSNNIDEGYGEDTTIFVTSDELAESIQFTTDTGSVKNCFKLEAGDDLMTATIRNCNPNGTDYIWYISDDVKEDMSSELVSKIESYDDMFDTYQNDYVINVDSSILTQYNNLVKKYQTYNKDLQTISSPIKGYPNLMTAIYNTIDLSLFLESALMPDATMQDTDALKQAKLLISNNLSPVAVTDISKISLATANSAVLAMAKVIIDSRYRVKVNDSNLNGTVWTGNFVVTNYSDDEDTAISSTVTVSINDDYEYFVRQKLNKAIKDKDTEELSITGLFKLDYSQFCNELKKYGLNSLVSFHDACQACIDILIEQGIATSETWSGKEPNLYDDLYTPYYNKLNALESEIKTRQSEIDLIEGVYDSDGMLTKNGLQTYLDKAREEIQKQLDFQNYIGNELWLEFCTYRREDKYSNANYISDGLSNAELFEKALEFHKVARNEIYKSAELQHSISSSLKNLLVMDKFKPLIKHFNTGNWIRILVDGEVYKLRLLGYEIDFDNIDSLSVEFSDVLKTANGESDQKSIMSKITSITTSYDSVQKQASQGAEGNKVINTWFADGLDATNTKIIGGADNQSQTWDSHGMLFRKYNPITDSYDDTQLKIVNSTMAITDDNWKTVKTAVGAYYYVHPETGKLTMAYGINGETLVGKLILGEQLGIYNDSGSLTFNKDGFLISNGTNSFRVNPNSEVLLAISNSEKDVFWIDDNGMLHISGDGSGLDISSNSDITGMQSSITQTAEQIRLEVKDEVDGLSSSITQTAEQIRLEVKDEVDGLSSSITQTAKEIRAEVKDEVDGLNSTITQTAEQIRSEVEDEVNGLSSSITQTAKEIRAEVEDEVNGLSTSIKQNADKIELCATSDEMNSAIEVSAGEIKSYVDDKESGLQSKITQNANNITLEVNRAKDAEDGLSSKISLNEKEIKLKVSQDSYNEKIGSIESSITQNADNITLEVNRAKGAESDLGSRIKATEDSIELCVKSEDFGSMIEQHSDRIVLQVKDNYTPDSLHNSSVTINTNGVSLTGGTISIQSGVSFLVNSGGTVKISAGNGNESYISLGEAFSVSKNGLSATTGSFGTLTVGGKKVLTEDSIGLDSRITVSATKPSGNNIIWLCPTAVNNVVYRAYTGDTRNIQLKNNTKNMTLSCTSSDVLPNSSYKYSIKFPIYLTIDGSKEKNVKLNVVATKASNSNLKVTFPEYTVASIGEWEQVDIEIIAESTANLCEDAGNINIAISTSNVSTNNLFIQKETYAELIVSDKNAAGSTQACSVYYIP